MTDLGTVQEILKWVVLGNALLLLVQCVRVVSLYAAIYSLSPHDWRRQLPLHVWIMALSFTFYVAVTSYFIFVALDHQWTRLALYGTAGFLAQYGLWNILQYDSRRYSMATNFRDTDDPQRQGDDTP